jgi:hypothetical protein
LGYTTIGDQVGMAQRMESVAPPGGVMLSASTARLVDGAVDLIRDDGEHPLAAGDTVVVTGVDHAWRAGPDGRWLSVLTIGASPPNLDSQRHAAGAQIADISRGRLADDG